MRHATKGAIPILLAIAMTGCSSSTTDISNSYWDGKAVWTNKDGMAWPDWNKMPAAQGVKIGEHSIPAADRMEYVKFAWDKTGLYGYVFAFDFPPIDVSRPDEQRLWHTARIDASGGQMNKSLGKPQAWMGLLGQPPQVVDPSLFRCADYGWVMKPGQCAADFWISWKALGSDGPPKQAVRIRVKDQTLTLTPRPR